MSSSDVLNAVIAKLGADAPLLALMPNGVYEDEAPPNSTRFVIVSQIIAQDRDEFQRRAWEDVYLLIEARASSTVPGADVKGAADRIDLLLDPQPPLPPATLTVAGYDVMVIKREEFVRHNESDDGDVTLRWKRRGERYRVMVSVRPQT
jgi:hypothetical protein